MGQPCHVTPEVRDATPADRPAVDALHDAVWGGPVVVGHGRAFDLRTLPTLLAEGPDGRVVGALAYEIADSAMEVVSIVADPPGSGAGGALLDAAVGVARAARANRVWLVTTNDNLDALRMYQRHGMRLMRLDPGAVDRSRAVKPEIPLVGAYGIPLRDELTLELRLDA
jgi:ribosomal protein S18 acetylase RimI-like enzyme